MNTRDIAQDCYLRIGANNGYYHRDYFITCVDDAIKEALSALQAENARLRDEVAFWAKKCFICDKAFTAEEWTNTRRIMPNGAPAHDKCYRKYYNAKP